MQQRWVIALAAIVLSLLCFGFLTSYADATTQRQFGPITINGRVEVGTEGGRPLPANLPLELRIIDTETLTRSAPITTIVRPDGSFEFTSVPALEGNDFYLIYATYAGFRQQTRPIFAEQAEFVVFLVYETTTATDGLQVIDGYIQLDEFARIAETGTNWNIVMELQIVNRGDKIVYDPETGTSLSLELPVGSYGIEEVIFGEEQQALPQRLRVDEGFIPVVHETTPLIPGWPTHTIRLYFLMSYPGEAIWDQPFPLHVEELELLVPEDTVYIEEDLLIQTDETRFIAPERPNYTVFELSEPLKAGESLIFSMQGDPLPSATNTASVSTSQDDDSSGLQQVLLIVGGALFLVFLFVVWAVVRSRQAALVEMTEQDKSI